MATSKALDIKRQVEEQGKSLSDIAREMGVSRQYISRLLKESGITIDLKPGNRTVNRPPEKSRGRADDSTYKLSETTYRLKIPAEVEKKFRSMNMKSADITAWIRKAVEQKAIKDFQINLQ